MLITWAVNTYAFKIHSSIYTDPGVIVIQQGKQVTLHAAVANAAAYQWFNEKKAIPGAVKSEYTVNASGLYTVIAYSKQACSSDESEPMKVIVINATVPAVVDISVAKIADPKPVAVGDVYTYTIIVTNKTGQAATSVQMKDILPKGMFYVGIKSATTGSAEYDSDSQTITWEIGNMKGNTTEQMQLLVKAASHGPIKNTAIVSSLEPDADLSNNTAISIKDISGLNIPNVFTPNGDGVNDTFEIAGLSDYPDNTIDIFNRWGNSIYHKQGYLNDWTGNGLNEGTYFYVITIKDSAGISATFKGYVTLLRSRNSEE
jgi:gliding motility-associated-like protein/uncharacterized repeat protein (TIGR01451 family)